MCFLLVVGLNENKSCRALNILEKKKSTNSRCYYFCYCYFYERKKLKLLVGKEQLKCREICKKKKKRERESMLMMNMLIKPNA